MSAIGQIDRQIFPLTSIDWRRRCWQAVKESADTCIVTIAPPTRNKLQNAALHAMLSDIVKAGTLWDNSTHDIEFWKSLVVSGWAIATKAQGEVTKGIEGEIVLIRRSTTTMSKAEMTSLIDYLAAFLDTRGIPRREP